MKEAAAEFVYKNIGTETRIMIECLANFENHGALPQRGGLLDQSPLFVEALRIWNSAGQIFSQQRDRVKNMAKKLGAFNVRKK